MKLKQYGKGSSTFVAVGGLEGVKQLVSDFYNIMSTNQDYLPIRQMHPENLEVSIDKLACFLSGWMGGERLYQEKYGSINIPKVHAFLTIETTERDLWLACMNDALSLQGYPNELVDYLNQQFFIPAEKIRLASKENSH